MALYALDGSSTSCQNLFRILLSLLFISTFLQLAAKSTTTTDSLKAYKKFIKDQCNSTTYPNVCYKSLSPYTSKIKTNRVTLTKVSIYVALKAAKSASSTLTKLSNSKGKLTHGETLVIADCRENIEDAVDLLEQSADGLAHLNGTTTSHDKFQWDNIKTWMSAAITDETTCTDEFDEIQVRPSLQKKIKTSVDNVHWLNSNALAFVNRLPL
ncbi:21 kDa protein [Spatholobus suberectus]|nr:21 kDa protein [Spatholobus suberectus]